MTVALYASWACSTSSTSDKPGTAPDTAADVNPTVDSGTDDTGCVPSEEILLDGVDQDCDGPQDDFGVGDPLTEASWDILVGDEESDPYGFGLQVDIGFDHAGNQWIAVAGSWSAEFIPLDPTLGEGLYVSTSFVYEYPSEYAVRIANWDGPPFLSVGNGAVRLFDVDSASSIHGATFEDVVLELPSSAASADTVDLDGDGIDELITGARVDGLQARRAPTDLGFPEPYLVIQPGVGSANFGHDLGDVGDVTGDGVPEWTVYSEDGAGKAWFMPSGLEGTFVSHDVGWHLDGEDYGDDMGRGIALGDVNGDGYMDVAATAHMANDEMGIEYVVHGPVLETAPIADVAIATVLGQFDRDLCGLARGNGEGEGLGMLDDQDGDGAAELVVACGHAFLPARLEIYAGHSLSGVMDYSGAARLLVSQFRVALSAETREDLTGDGLQDLVASSYFGTLPGVDGSGAVFIVASPLL